jgi:hypothetical protein
MDCPAKIASQEYEKGIVRVADHNCITQTKKPRQRISEII